MAYNKKMILPAIAGAAIGAIAGAMLSSDENRKTIRKVAKNVRSQGMERAETVAHELMAGSRKLSNMTSKKKIRRGVKNK
jgi:gas vesicle protein